MIYLHTRNSTRVALGLILAFAVTACTQAEFGGGRKSKPSANAAAGKSGDAKSKDKDGKDAKSLGDTDKDGSGKGKGKRGQYEHDPITDNLESGGWVTTLGDSTLRQIFDTSGGGGPGSPSGGDGGLGGPDDPSKTPVFDTLGGPESGDDDDGSSGKPGTGGDSATGDVTAWEGNEDGLFWVPCDPLTGSGSAAGSISGPAGAVVRVAGEFCPKKEENPSLSVLFVVDFSGSMEGPFEGPNDPLTAGSCGRLKAAEALLDKFATFNGLMFQAAMVGFSNASDLRVPFSDFDAFRASLTADNWCGSDSAAALTNYAAAFTQAKAALNGIPGDKVIYFISDGSPTLGGGLGQSDAEAGLAAAVDVRNTYGGELVLNAVFLGYTGGSADNPQGYLEEITGDPNAVRVVGGADELVAAVTTLDVFAATIQKENVTGTHAAGGSSKAVGLKTFKQSAERAGAYIYLSESITLVGKPGSSTENIVTYEAKDNDGNVFTSTATITYKVDK